MSMFVLQLGAIKWPINQKAFVMVGKAFNDANTELFLLWQVSVLWKRFKVSRLPSMLSLSSGGWWWGG